MLNTINRNISLDGQSIIADEVIASMNMNINGSDGTTGAYINMNISDVEKLLANKAAVMADFTEFYTKAVDLIEDIEKDN